MNAKRPFPPLEEQCPVCHGSGESCDREDDKCVRCSGTGRAPTQFGEEVVELIRHHLAAILCRILNGQI
jgi:RecJ-like exonuclease